MNKKLLSIFFTTVILSGCSYSADYVTDSPKVSSKHTSTTDEKTNINASGTTDATSIRTYHVGNRFYKGDFTSWFFKGFIDSDTFVISKNTGQYEELFFITAKVGDIFAIPNETDTPILKVENTYPNTIELSEVVN